MFCCCSYFFLLGAFWFFEVILGYGARCGSRFFVGICRFRGCRYPRRLLLLSLSVREQQILRADTDASGHTTGELDLMDLSRM